MRFLLVSDLDNTLVGDDQALSVLKQSLQENREQISLIYATGRSYTSARALQKEQTLLEPDFWITGVGSEIYHQGTRDLQWAQQLSEGWDRAQAVSIAQKFPPLSLQPINEQNPHKISYFLDPNANTDILTKLQLALTDAGLAMQVVFSSNRDVDILSTKGDKGRAVLYLRDQLNVSAEKTLVCGDSGNDISLFKHSQLGLIVSNAQPELLDWHRNYGQPSHYLADKPYAWGILEGLSHFQLLESMPSSPTR
jgi:sucrose-6-phosphatase